MRFLKGSAAVCILAALSVTAAAQTARVAGLEDNREYMSLLGQEHRLNATEDSVLKVIDRTRDLFARDTEGREKYRDDILRLEKELFEVRDSVGIVSSKLSAIEQGFIISNVGRGTSPATISAPEGTSKAGLVYNAYFSGNLDGDDYASLLSAQRAESAVEEMVDKYIVNYDILTGYANEYREAVDKDTATAIYEKYLTLTSLNRALNDSLRSVWGYTYDNKTYAYIFLLDKMNRNDLISGFERDMREVNQKIVSESGAMASAEVYAYPLQKTLVLACEKSLADILGYGQAADSIAKVAAGLEKRSFSLSKIELEERVFIDYEDIVIASPSRYNASNPIPENEIYRKGTVYKIQVGTFARSQPVSVFRYAAPLSYDILEDGRYRYYAGAFRTVEEAEASLEQMKRAGFRNPEIVVWRDSAYENVSAAPAAPAGTQVYRVEIIGESENISERTKDIIDTMAPGKELSRAISPEGKYIYTVGSFDNRETAGKLAEQLGSVGGITAEVLVIDIPLTDN